MTKPPLIIKIEVSACDDQGIRSGLDIHLVEMVDTAAARVAAISVAKLVAAEIRLKLSKGGH